MKEFVYNKDANRREQILFCKDYNPEDYKGGYKKIRYLTVERLQQLVDEKFADPEMNQNGSPTIAKLLEYGKNHETVVYSGYVIGPAREDYRVSINAISQDFKKIENSKTSMLEFTRNFKSADKFDANDSYGHAWWD